MGTIKYQKTVAAEQLEQWILDFLLTGDCQPKIRAYVWNRNLGGCLCNPWVFLPIWKSVRGVVLREWKKQHPDGSMPWVELQTPDAEAEIQARGDGELPPLTADDIAEIEKRINRD